jgi:predicted exporter
MALRADIGAPDSRYMVVINAADREAALQAAEKTGAQLDELVRQGLIGGYDSPARFLPSQATQAARRASLPAGRIAPAPASRPAGFAARRQKARRFIADIASARHRPTLERATLDNGTSLALAVDSLLLQRGESWSVLLPLAPRRTGDRCAGTRKPRWPAPARCSST